MDSPRTYEKASQSRGTRSTSQSIDLAEQINSQSTTPRSVASANASKKSASLRDSVSGATPSARDSRGFVNAIEPSYTWNQSGADATSSSKRGSNAAVDASSARSSTANREKSAQRSSSKLREVVTDSSSDKNTPKQPSREVLTFSPSTNSGLHASSGAGGNGGNKLGQRGNPKNTGYKYVDTDGHSYVNSRASTTNNPADQAATKVQAAFRGFSSRRASLLSRQSGSAEDQKNDGEISRVIEESNAASVHVDLGRPEDAGFDDAEETDEFPEADKVVHTDGRKSIFNSYSAAATRVQSVFRGFRVRKMSNIFVPPSAIRMDSATEDEILEEVETLKYLTELKTAELAEELKAASASSHDISDSMMGLLSRSNVNLNESNTAHKIQSLFRDYQVRRSSEGGSRTGSQKVRDSLDSMYMSLDGPLNEERDLEVGDAVITEDDGSRESEESPISEHSHEDFAAALEYYDEDEDDINPETMDAVTGKETIIRKLSELQQGLQGSSASVALWDDEIHLTSGDETSTDISRIVLPSDSVTNDISITTDGVDSDTLVVITDEEATSAIGMRAIDSLKASLISLSAKKVKSWNGSSHGLGGPSQQSQAINIVPVDDEVSSSNGFSRISAGSTDMLLTVDAVGRFNSTSSDTYSVSGEPRPLKSSLKHPHEMTVSANELHRSRVSFRNLTQDDDDDDMSTMATKGSEAVLRSNHSLSNSDSVAVSADTGESGGSRNIYDEQKADAASGGPAGAKTRKRPVSAPPLNRPKQRPISSPVKYNQTIKFSGFEFRRMPGVEAMADQLVDHQRVEMEHINRLMVLRLTNPWSALTNSDVLFQEAAWESIKQRIADREEAAAAERPRPRSAHELSRRPTTALPTKPFTMLNLPPHMLANPKPPKTPRPVKEPLPPSVRKAHTKMGPVDWNRIDELSKPRRSTKPITPEQALAAIVESRKPKKLKPMDPIIFARLTKPRKKIDVETEVVKPSSASSRRQSGSASVKKDKKRTDSTMSAVEGVAERAIVNDEIPEVEIMSSRDTAASAVQGGESAGNNEERKAEDQGRLTDREVAGPGSQGSLDTFTLHDFSKSESMAVEPEALVQPEKSATADAELSGGPELEQPQPLLENQVEILDVQNVEENITDLPASAENAANESIYDQTEEDFERADPSELEPSQIVPQEVPESILADVAQQVVDSAFALSSLERLNPPQPGNESEPDVIAQVEEVQLQLVAPSPPRMPRSGNQSPARASGVRGQGANGGSEVDETASVTESLGSFFD